MLHNEQFLLAEATVRIFCVERQPVIGPQSRPSEALAACFFFSPYERYSPIIDATMTDSQLFEDTFTLTSLNAQKYDRVSRIFGTSTSADTTFTLDVNTELYPCAVGDQVQLVIASTLALDGTKDDGKGWRQFGRGEANLGDMFDYVCHGKVYRFDEGEDENIKVFMSFGGLLLYIEGPYKKMTPLRVDYIYLLMKK